MLQFTYDFKTVIHVTLIKWKGNAEWMDAVRNAFRNVQIRIKKHVVLSHCHSAR